VPDIIVRFEANLDFLKNILINFANIKFDGNPSTEIRFDTCGRTYRRDEANRRFFFAVMRKRLKMYDD